MWRRIQRAVEAVASGVLGVVLWPPLFRVFSALFTAYVTAGVFWLHSLGGSDVFYHLAHFAAFAARPLSPGNPYLGAGTMTHLLTPYHLAWGLVARMLGTHPMHLLPVMGAANMILFLWATRRVARSVMGDARYAVPLALTMLLLWRHPWAWSGFYNLGLLPLTAIYPSWFTLGLAMHVLATHAAAGPHRARAWMGMGLGVALAGLVHPLTAAFLAVGLVALTWVRGCLKGDMIGLTAIFGVALLAAETWPYFPVLRATIGVREFGAAHFESNYAFFNERLVWRLAPALLGLVHVADALRRRERSFVAAGVVLCAAIFALNQRWLHLGPLGRFVTYVILFLHWAVVKGLADAPQRRWGAWYTVAWAVLLLVCLKPEALRSLVQFGPVRAALRFNDLGPEVSNRAYYRRYRPYRQFIGPEDVVMANMQLSYMVPAFIGCRAVGLMHTSPFVRDYQDRAEAVRRFFTIETSWPERKTLLRRYRVDFVIADRGWLEKVGGSEGLAPVFEDDLHVLYRVTDNIKAGAAAMTGGE